LAGFPRFFLIGMILIAGLICAGCGTSTSAPTVASEALEMEILPSALTADGRVIPREWVQLSFSTGGLVSEIAVEGGDMVKKGDILARLGNREALEAAVSAAQLELVLAEQAYQALNDQLKAEQQLALQSVYNTRQAVENAEQQLEYWQSSSVEADADLADAQVIRAGDELDTARTNYEDYEDEDRDNLTPGELYGRIGQCTAYL
jgi:multidrug efflux pump subunit AcrA (membrane-fusion protein)